MNDGDRFDRPLPRLVLFDLDDTLADYATARRLRLERAFRAQLTHLPPDVVETMIPSLVSTSIARSPHGTEHFAELLGRYGVRPDGAEAAASWYRTNRFAHLALFPDAAPVVTIIRSHQSDSRKIGIVTNGPPGVQRDKVRLLGIDSLADVIVISGEVGVEKPNPAIFELALDAAGASAANAIMIGDAPEFDILGARNAGIRSIWFNRHGTVWPYADWAPDYIVGSLPELVPILAPRAAAHVQSPNEESR